MANAAALRARYVQTGIASASPARLLLQLMDRLVLDVELAVAALGTGTIAVSGPRLLHAQDILLHLRTTLDLQLWPAGESLAAVYAWCQSELAAANVTRSVTPAAQCLPLLRQLRDTWYEAHRLTAGE